MTISLKIFFRRHLFLYLLCFGILPGTGGCGGNTRGTGGSGPRVSGTVTRASTGLPLANTLITILQTGETARTDANGFFEIANSSFAGGILQIGIADAVADIGRVSAEARSIAVELRFEDDGSLTTVSTDIDGEPEIGTTDPRERDEGFDDPLPLPDGDTPGANPGSPPPPPIATPTPNTPTGPTPTPTPAPPTEENPPLPPVAGQGEFIQLPDDRIFNPILADANQEVYAYVPLRDGIYSEAALWAAGGPPSQVRYSHTAQASQRSLPPGGSQIIIPQNVTLTIDTQIEENIRAIAVYGTLRFAPEVNTKLKVGTLLVHPGGTLEIGTTSQHIAEDVFAEIEIADQAIHENDSESTGTGIIALGKIDIHGSPSPINWMRLAQEVHASDTEIILKEAPTNWGVGDELALPDTRFILARIDRTISMSETVRISAIRGRTIVLDEPTRFDHLAAKDSDGQVQFLPHVARLSRNVLIHSENPEGTRGYVYLGDRARVDIQNARFKNLGRTDLKEARTDSAVFEFTERNRTTGDIYVFEMKAGQITPISGVPRYWPTAYRSGVIAVWNRRKERQEMELLSMRVVTPGSNQIARYAVTIKDLLGAENPEDIGYQYTFSGNTVDHSKMFAIGVLDSHFGLLESNVIYNAQGAGITFREGTERGNEVVGNIAINIKGDGSTPGYHKGELGMLGASGVGFWQNRPKNTIRGNVSADTSVAGFEFGGGTMFESISPIARGVDKFLPDKGIHFKEVPTGVFENNEAYGRTLYGFWMSNYDRAEILVSDLTVWHATTSGILVGYAYNIRIEGFEVLCDQDAVFARAPNKVAPWHFSPMGVYANPAGGSLLEIKYGSVSGCHTGIMTRNNSSAISGRSTRVSDTYLKNYENVVVRTPGGASSFEFQRIVSEHPPVADFKPERPKKAFVMKFNPSRMNFMAPGKTSVKDFQGIPGNDFSLYYLEQAPTYTVPNFTPHTGHEELPLGRTNQYYWDNHLIAIAGGIAPCLTTEPEITGFVCPLAD